MPYPLTANAQAKINRRDDVSVTTVVEIDIGGNTLRYSEYPVFNSIKGLRVNTSIFELLNNAGQTGSVPISICDEDGSLKSIITSTNIIKNAISVFMVFEDLTWDDRVLVFNGTLETPFKWNENTRIVTFNCVPQQLNGKIPAPIVFGDMPGVEVVDPLDGLKATSPIYTISAGKKNRNAGNIIIGNNSFSVDREMPDEMVGPVYTLLLGNILVTGYFQSNTSFLCQHINTSFQLPNIQVRNEDDLDYENMSVAFITAINPDSPGMEQGLSGKYLRIKINVDYEIWRFRVSEFEKLGGSPFGNRQGSYSTPPTSPPTIPDEIDEEVFDQSIFLVNQYTKEDYNLQTTMKHDEYEYICKCSSHDIENGKITLDKPPTNMMGEPLLLDNNNSQLIGVYGEYPLRIKGNMYNEYSEHWTTGDNASIEFFGLDREHLVSVIPANEVVNVFDRDMILQPESDYTVELTPELKINTGKIGTIWCSIESSVGPNIIDIIKYIIENYTTLTFDMTDYAALHLKHENFPIGFYYPEEVKVSKCIKDLCYQSCLEYTIYSGNFILKDATSRNAIPSILTLDRASTELGSIIWETSNSKNIVTDITGTWSKTEYPKHIEEEYKANNNTDKFEEVIKTIDYPIYHAEGSVERSVTWYLDLLSNIWENVSFRCFLHAMNLYLYERVTADLFELGNYTGIIKEFDFNANTPSTKLKLDTGRSLTGGVGYLDGDWDGTYSLEKLDSDYLKLDEAKNDLPNNYLSTTKLLPTLVPGEGYQLFSKYMLQKFEVKMRVLRIYRTCLVCEIIGEDKTPKSYYYKAFGKNPMGAKWIVAYPNGFDIKNKYFEFKADEDLASEPNGY